MTATDDRSATVKDVSIFGRLVPRREGHSGPHGGRWRWTVFGSLWLVFLAEAVHEVIVGDSNWGVKAVALAGVAVFCLAYALIPPLLFDCPPDDRRRWGFTIAMFVLATALLPLTHQDGLSFYVFVAVVAIMMLPTRSALLAVGCLLLLAPLIATTMPGTMSAADIDLPIATAAAAVFGLVSVIRRNAELAQAREELAEFAVAEERARFARDLHDILGHSLTVITVKSELARRLLPRDADRASAEIADIERLAREALADVRATVAGYREVSLAAEIANARSVLSAAGIEAEVPNAVDDIPGDRRDLFAWVVREGVTNVVRHSRATRCWVRVAPDFVEVADDGQGSSGGSAGNGLAGLHERVAAAGAELITMSRENGGYVLRVELASGDRDSPKNPSRVEAHT